jgi:hypothetical protein
MTDFAGIAEKQLQDQMEMGFITTDVDLMAEGEEKVIEDHKEKIRAGFIKDIEDGKIKNVQLISSNNYNLEIAEQVAEQFVRKLSGTNKNKIYELKDLIVEALMEKNSELERKLHGIKNVEQARIFASRLFKEFERIDRDVRDGRFLRETDNTITIRFADKNAREYQNRNKKNWRESRVDEFKRIIHGVAVGVDCSDFEQSL